MSDKIEIIYKDKDLVVINKPVGMPSQSDPTGDADALSETSALLISKGDRGELFLLHRLDRGVGGVLMFARNKTAAAKLNELISSRKIKKEYLAVASGSVAGGEYNDLLYKDARRGRSYVVDRMRGGVKEARLYAEVVEKKVLGSKESSLVRVSLYTGRHHQIRVQLSSRGNPLIGDKKYGGSDRSCKAPSLFATSLSFSLAGKEYSFELLPDKSAYPWCEFEFFKDKGESL